MLRDPAAFAADHVDPDHPIQERSLAVVDVPQERNHRRPRGEVLRIVFLIQQAPQQLFLDADRFLQLEIDPQFGGNQFREFGIDDRVDLGHHPLFHENPQDLARGDTGRLGEFTHGAGELERNFVFPGSSRADARAARPSEGPAGAILIAAVPILERLPLPTELPLFATSQNGGIVFAGDLALAAAFASRRIVFGDRRGFFAPLLGRIERFFMPPQMGRQRLAAGFPGPQGLGGQPEIGLLDILFFDDRGGGPFGGRNRGQLDRRPAALHRTTRPRGAFLVFLFVAAGTNRPQFATHVARADVIVAPHDIGQRAVSFLGDLHRGRRGLDQRFAGSHLLRFFLLFFFFRFETLLAHLGQRRCRTRGRDHGHLSGANRVLGSLGGDHFRLRLRGGRPARILEVFAELGNFFVRQTRQRRALPSDA